MHMQDKTKEELIKELQELRQENRSLKEINNRNANDFLPHDAMLETNSKLALAMQGGNMAWWQMDVKTGNVTFDKHKVEMLGYAPENFKHYRDFTNLVHPNDYERIMDAMKGHLDGIFDKYEAEYRIMTKSGEYIWFYDYGSVVKKDSKGAPLICTGFVYNITERKQNEETLAKNEQMLQTVLDNFPGVVFWKDRQSKYLGCNQAFATGAGLKNTAEVVGKTDLEMPWASTGAINYLKDDTDVMEFGKEKLHIIEMLHQSNGQEIWLNTSKFPLRDSPGQIIGVIGVSNDISMLKRAEQELINKNIELAIQNEEKEKRADELIIANNELAFQNEEKGKRAAELIIANKELAYESMEKGNRAAELSIVNIELTAQNIEIEESSAELIIAKERAEQSDRLKSAFLANMSHEIRTPMNGILGFASILREADLSGEEQLEYLELMEQSGARMLNIINDIVDISKHYCLAKRG